MNDSAQAIGGNCYVIGGAGFIGRAVVKHLLQVGRKVVVVDRGTTPVDLPEGVTYCQGDYGDRAFLEGLLTEGDEVIHLAYASIPKTSFEDPFSDLLHNVPPALTLFEVASKCKLQKLVLISSGGTVYGQANELPIPETHATNPISPYGITKLAIEKYAGLFHTLHGLPVVTVRPANAYGEEQKPFTGQGFIATAIASIMQNKEITLFGETGSVRDYIHVDDIASGIVAALQAGVIGEVYNLGTEIGVTNKDVLALLADLAKKSGLTPRVTHQAERTFDVSANILSTKKIQHDTGWNMTVSLEEGLQKVWAHHQAQHE